MALDIALDIALGMAPGMASTIGAVPYNNNCSRASEISAIRIRQWRFLLTNLSNALSQ